MAMVMQSQSSEWPMKFCVCVCVLYVRKTKGLVPVCKRERENKKRNKSCLYCFSLFSEFAFGKWCGGAGRCGVEWRRTSFKVFSSDSQELLLAFIMAGLYVPNILSSNNKLISFVNSLDVCSLVLVRTPPPSLPL
jgi:hypothetical protein